MKVKKCLKNILKKGTKKAVQVQQQREQVMRGGSGGAAARDNGVRPAVSNLRQNYNSQHAPSNGQGMLGSLGPPQRWDGCFCIPKCKMCQKRQCSTQSWSDVYTETAEAGVMVACDMYGGCAPGSEDT
ncbi:hypothetical protein GDO78_016558 [Eleutherodactylus coqui]|uniref:Uncharacterized protein n=1 Tax=Eleutherodactylus coqui TaxID=57060 RepID=A0A8J6ECU1_ELECQ|nr:hypothetical protein GDO78_016558 [Eleutherodactylus coqui]